MGRRPCNHSSPMWMNLFLAAFILSSLLYTCHSFSSSMPKHRQSPSFLLAIPDTTDNILQPRVSRRRRILNALKKTPKVAKKAMCVVGLSVALWRGPVTQPSYAATKNARSQAIVVTPLKVAGKKATVKGAVAVTTGSAAVLTGVRLEKKRRKDPERIRLRRLRKAKEEKLKKLKRLTQIRQELEFLLQDATNTDLPLMTPEFIEARRQPKSPEEEDLLAAKYAAIKSLADRAYQILLDLGMIEESYVVDLDIIWKLLEQ